MDDDMAAFAVGGDDEAAYAALSPRTRRKRKNRDQMRAARQREKETMERLHGMVERLETQFRKLEAQKQVKKEANTTAIPPKSLNGALPPKDVTKNMTPAAYAEALSLKARYQEENFHLKQTLYEKNKLKETLERHVGDFVEPTPEEQYILKEEFGGPGSEPATSIQETSEGPSQPAGSHASEGQKNAYTPLSESAVWAIIADGHRRKAVIEQSLSTPSTASVTSPLRRMTVTVVSSPGSATRSDDEFTAGGKSPVSPGSPPWTPNPSQSLPAFCGWDIRHKCMDNELRFYFEKPFPHITAFNAMVRMWDNEISMCTYRDGPVVNRQTMRVVQLLNDDTYIFQRRLADASTGHRELVTTYLRYRLRAGEGFLVGSLSIDDAILELQADGHKDADLRQRVWGASLLLWTEFVPIMNNTGCSVRMTGSVGTDDPQRNLATLVIGMLRWENLNVGPMFALAGP